ncbi:MAG: hypothetical protein ABIJ75_05735 [Actinomycetota bacterium]
MIDATTGLLTATGATISGTVTAAAGAVGGWVIGATSLADAAGAVGLSSAVTAGDDIRFWAGHTTPGSAPFRVTEAGALFASGATISGTLTATAGTIGGWTLAATTLTGGEAILSAAGKLTIGSGNDTVMLSATNATYRLWVGDASGPSAPFRVTKAGALVATSATITGAITATSGSLSGLSVTGTLTLAGSGKLITAAAGQRVEITSIAYDRINFYTGNVDESSAGFIQGNASFVGISDPTLYIRSPGDTGTTSYVVISPYGTTVGGILAGTQVHEGVYGTGGWERVYSANNPPPVHDHQAGAKVWDSSGVSVSDNAWVYMPFDSETFDYVGWHSLSTWTGRIIPTGIPDGCLVVIGATIAFPANGTGTRGMQIRLKGSAGTVLITTAATPLSTNPCRVHAVTVAQYSTGDWYDIAGYQNSGSALTTMSGATNNEFWVIPFSGLV